MAREQAWRESRHGARPSMFCDHEVRCHPPPKERRSWPRRPRIVWPRRLRGAGVPTVVGERPHPFRVSVPPVPRIRPTRSAHPATCSAHPSHAFRASAPPFRVCVPLVPCIGPAVPRMRPTCSAHPPSRSAYASHLFRASSHPFRVCVALVPRIRPPVPRMCPTCSAQASHTFRRCVPLCRASVLLVPVVCPGVPSAPSDRTARAARWRGVASGAANGRTRRCPAVRHAARRDVAGVPL
jgi:hypothetical protein